MKGKILLPVLAACLLLTGCGWMGDGQRHVSVSPHEEQRTSGQAGTISASDYLELMEALENMIAAGTETAAINVADYPTDAVESGMAVAVKHVTQTYPIGAYAVESVEYETGTSGGLPALAVTIHYRHTWAEMQRIHQAEDMTEVEKIILEALEDYDANVVMQVADYHGRDLTQLVEDYALEHPELVMETPQVTESVYGVGTERVVELIFTYQNSRESLRQMRSQVEPVFNSATLYVSGDGAERQKYSQLYAFLMERYDYTLETSITPAYSLLRHGVGDSRAFATVYAAMCRSAGLECMTVTGTRSGEPWTWNIVGHDGNYYHVDLLRSSQMGKYQEFGDGEMSGYVWDYSAYPECRSVGRIPETSQPEDWEPESESEIAAVETESETTEASVMPKENFEDF